MRILSAGNLVRKWGSFAIAEGENGDPMALFGPRALDFDLEGNLVVADAGNKRILIFTANGDYVTQVGGGGVVAGRFDEPTGVGVDPTDGSILVADAWNQRVQRFDNNLIFQSEFKVPGWYGRDVFQKPFISVASDGSIYTTDPATSQVVVFDRNGAVKFAFGGPGTGLNQFGLPTGIAVDRAGGNVVIADGGSNRVVVVPEQK
ncbi:MAG: NHL repeat-containing protein [Anaerolineales bacterium]|nr:NHL repeat-containing protein [Anaerolineales bacterium]